MPSFPRLGPGMLRMAAAGTIVALSVGVPVLPQPAGGRAGSSATAATYPTYRIPAGGLVVKGHGWGNGIGLSQWGAYGAAAVDGLTSGQILTFYYPHTHTRTLSTRRVIRVLLSQSAAAGASAGVDAVTGLQITAGGVTTTLPRRIAGARVTAWRIRYAGSSARLQDERGGNWHPRATPAGSDAPEFTAPGNELTVITSTGIDRSYRGGLEVADSAGQLLAINDVDIEDYVAGVVPNEMSPSWPRAALRAQAVAARTYATYEMRHPRSSLWDAYGDGRDQAYGGADTESAATTAAVEATAGQTRFDNDNRVVFAAYGAADGGETEPGTVAGEPVDYLPARADPYDDLEPNSASAWQATLTRDAIAVAFPEIGSPRSVTVKGREGRGQWGGRITLLTVHGTDRSVTVSGASFAGALGLRSPWWHPTERPNGSS